MEKTKDFPASQKNLAIYDAVERELQKFCKDRHLAEGQTVSVAIHYFMGLKADEREAAAIKMRVSLAQQGGRVERK